MKNIISEIKQSIKIRVKLDNDKIYLIDKFEEEENSLKFTSEDNIRGEVFFISKKNAIVLGIKFMVENETSYLHPTVSKLEILLKPSKDGNFLAHYNYNGWWTRPHFTKTEKEIPQNTQLLAWEKDNISTVIMTLCDDEFKSVISGEEDAVSILATANTCGYSSINTKLCVFSFSENPYTAFENAVLTALDSVDTTKRPAKDRRYPKMLDYLGFCTWNAFYSDVYKDGVLEKADEFVNKNIPVKWFLIDHGWSCQTHDKLDSFKENMAKFPGGLMALKEELKMRGIENLGVWQGFGGHWGTVNPDGEIYKSMKNSLLETNTGAVIPYPSKEKSFDFWNTWHRYLKQQGVDFVKVDIQSSLSVFTKGLMPIGKAARETHLGLEASVGVNFDGNIINCMGMATEQYINRPVSGVSRNSNDFFPHKDNSFKEHVYENAYNSLYHTKLTHGDWDMWWTIHPDALNNAFLRALSGGPLYISDKVSETDASKLTPLILDDGYVLRCENAGIITKDQIFADPTQNGLAVKVWNKKGNTSYIGAFNCDKEHKAVTTDIKASDMELTSADKYLVVNYANSEMKIVNKDDVLNYKLKESKSVLLSFTPLVNGFAFLGNRDKYISSAVIEAKAGNSFVLSQGGLVTLASENPVTVKVNSTIADATCQNNIYTVDCSHIKDKVIIEII